jgi:hypothetical protein
MRRPLGPAPCGGQDAHCGGEQRLGSEPRRLRLGFEAATVYSSGGWAVCLSGTPWRSSCSVNVRGPGECGATASRRESLGPTRGGRRADSDGVGRIQRRRDMGATCGAPAAPECDGVSARTGVSVGRFLAFVQGTKRGARNDAFAATPVHRVTLLPNGPGLHLCGAGPVYRAVLAMDGACGFC